MYYKKIIVALLLFSFFAGCHQKGEKQTEVASQKTDSSAEPGHGIESRESFFYRQTMDIHNEVMAKTGKLIGYQKKVQHQADSIRTMLASTDFPISISQRISKQLNSLDSLQKKLSAADSAMNAWMDQFDPDPKMPTTEARADYFEKQKKSAEAIKQMYFEALQEVEKFLKK